MNYETMESGELIREYARVSYCDKTDKDWRGKLSTIMVALRKAVIKEASVGAVMLYTTLDGPDGNEYIRADWHIVGNYPEDGMFDLIPKEKT